MNTGGWIILGLSVGTVTALFGWCMWMVFRTSDRTRSLREVKIRDPHPDDDDSDEDPAIRI